MATPGWRWVLPAVPARAQELLTLATALPTAAPWTHAPRMWCVSVLWDMLVSVSWSMVSPVPFKSPSYNCLLPV